MYFNRPVSVVPLALWLVITVLGGFSGAATAYGIMHAMSGIRNWYLGAIVFAAVAYFALCVGVWFSGKQVSLRDAALCVCGAGTVLSVLLWLISPVSLPQSLSFFDHFFMPLIAFMHLAFFVAVFAVSRALSSASTS
jgi:hypothetical protein